LLPKAKPSTQLGLFRFRRTIKVTLEMDREKIVTPVPAQMIYSSF